METDDFKQAIRAMSLPTLALLDCLVDKGILTEQEALDVLDCSGSVDQVGPLTGEAVAVLLKQQDCLAGIFDFRKVQRRSTS